MAEKITDKTHIKLTLNSETPNYGQYNPGDYYCDSWIKPDGKDLKGCDIHTCPLIGDYDELPYALQLTFWQVQDWFTYAIATRCSHHKRRKAEDE